MQALATPRQPQHDRAPPLSLRSRAGRVTPLPDLDMVELGRQGLLSGSITSPRVSRRQATLLRLPDGALRVVSQGANPTAVVTRAGAVVRLAGGAGADVAAGDLCGNQPAGDTIVLCPGRLLRDGGGSADEDEAFTLVEAAIQDLPAALREIARLRAALDAAAAAPAPTPLATLAPEPADAAPAADAPAPTFDVAPAPEPMEAEPTAPAADDAHEAEDAPVAVDAVAALAGAADLEAASLTHTDDGSRFLLRWRGGGASCVRVEDGAWRVVDVAGAATAEARVGRALALAAALAAADDVPRSSVDGAMAAFLGGAAPAAPSDDVEDAGDDDSAGDFEAEAAAGTAMLVEGDLASDGEASRYDDGSDDGGDDGTAGARFVEGLLADAAREKFDVTSMRWDGTSLRGVVAGNVDAATRLKWEVRVDVVATARDVVLRASTSDGPVVYGVAALPVLKLLEAAAAAPGSIARDAAVTGAAAALAPRDIANVLLHAVATANPSTSSAYDGLLELITSDASGDAVMAPATLAIQADAAAVNELATSEAVSLAPFAPLTLAEKRAAAAQFAGGPAFRRRTQGPPPSMPEPDLAPVLQTLGAGMPQGAAPLGGAPPVPAPAPATAPEGAAESAPLTTAEKSAVLKAIAELDDNASQEAVRRAAEIMLGQRKGSLDAKEAAVAAWLSSPERPKGASPLGAASSYQFKAVDRVFYDAEAGLVYGRVRSGDDTYTSVAFAAKPSDGDCLDPARSWSGGDDEKYPLLPPAAIAFSRLATEAVDVCALRTALLALPDLRAAALDLAFSVDTAGSGLDESVPRLLTEAAAAGSAPAPGTAYVGALRAVVLDATADEPALKTQEDRAAAGVAAALDGASDAYDKAQAEVQDARDNWVNGEDCGCEPEPYGRGECPCGDWDCYGDCDNVRPIECDCALEENPDVDRDEFAEDLLDRVDDRVACGKAVPGGVREAVLVGTARGLARARAPVYWRRIDPRTGRPGPPREAKVTAFGRTLHARIDERLDDMLDNAISAATEEGRPELLARLLPLQPAAPFPAGAVDTAMTRRPESRAVLLGAVEATAAALCARLKVEADCGTTRANLRELLARGWISSWETVKGACDLRAAGLRPHGLDLVDFALETAGHACAPPGALPEARRAAVAAIEARLATRAAPDTLRAASLLRTLAGEAGGDGAAAAARRILSACAASRRWDAWRVVALVALDVNDGAETVAVVTAGATRVIRSRGVRFAGANDIVKNLTDRGLALAAAGAPGLLAGLLPLRPAEPLPCDAIAAAMAQGPEQKATLLAAVNAAAAAKLAERLQTQTGFAPARRNIHELMARGWLAAWETVAAACALDKVETAPHCLDRIEFALEVACHASAPADARAATRRAAVTRLEAQIFSHAAFARALVLLRRIHGEEPEAGAAAAVRRALYTCAVRNKWDRWPAVCRLALELDQSADTINAARGGTETLLKRSASAGAAVVREGIANGWLPKDRSLAVAAFEGASQRLTLYTLALDEATRPGAPAALLTSVLDAIAAQPRPANALAGAAAAADAFIDRLAAHRPELALTFCLGGATSLESLAARQRVARMLLAHGSDDQLLAFARTQAARPSPRVVTLEVETADVGVTLTHAHEAQNTRYGGYGGYVPYGQPVKKGAKVVALGARAREACVMVGMSVTHINRLDVSQLNGTNAILERIRTTERPCTLSFSYPTPPCDFTAARAFGAYQVESNVAQQGFDNAVRTEYAKLHGALRAAIPDVVWLHAMLSASDRNCDAALRVLADAYSRAPQQWPRRLASEAEALRRLTLLGSACSTGHSRADLVLNCTGCRRGWEPGLRALAKLRALTLAGLPDATARPLFDALAERTIRSVNARVRRKIEGYVREFKTRTVAGLTPFAPPAPPPPPVDRRGPAAAPDPKRPRVDPAPAPEEEESQEISIVGVRTAEERDAEAFANAIVIEETQPEAAEEDDSQVMDLTLSQPDSAPPPAGDA